MNRNTLLTPLFVHWDVNPLFPIPKQSIERICDDLISSKVFVLNLLDPAPRISAESSFIIRRLSDEKIKVTLTAGYMSAAENDLISNVDKILVQIESLEQFVSISGKINILHTAKGPPAISFKITESSFGDIPEVLDLCATAGLREIHFPIQRPTETGSIFCPSEAQFNRLSERIGAIGRTGMDIVVHDPFLWRIFNEGAVQKQDGCQAGNTMLYISDDGEATPCPLLPLSLGNLRFTTLKDIFSSHQRRKVRELLSVAPNDCSRCDEVSNCGGGCRGRAQLLHGTLGKPDPACFRRKPGPSS